MPPSAARSRMATEVGSSHCNPNVIVPRHSLDTCRPVRPSLVCSTFGRYRAEARHRPAAGGPALGGLGTRRIGLVRPGGLSALGSLRGPRAFCRTRALLGDYVEALPQCPPDKGQ